MKTEIIKDSEFKKWLIDLKDRIRQSQLRAAVKVNSELLRLYWDLGKDIVVRQMDATWGSGFYKQVSKELKAEFPDMQGFSQTNLNYCKRFYQFYADNTELCKQNPIVFYPQAGGELQQNSLFSIPWGHQKLLIDKCKSVKEALFYVQKTIKNGWSRAMLMNFMDTDLYQNQGK